ncbi:MAG: tRNA (adenosine(37)-N6)-threonylcarbamoyltransferase complex transferase subunit TsaD [Candidatus Gracilibacteria bacterium]|nr:tRNA (adenosine(37)-N6)-threonylcarbamoyltransferase complex transferase subunit TsaD [Candidatus Gracilibacteria bacterium]
MYILAFETSCDDTSVAVFKDDVLLAMNTASQIKIHEQTGGVVPEVAAREHANAIFPVLDDTLKDAKVGLEDIDHIAVTITPGLIPSLLTGINVANSLSHILKKPIIEINHIESHIFANFLERKESDIVFPLVCLTVSGGHNEIYLMKDMWSFEKIGGTTDDAAGEAFDKVAKMMGLGYPGGPIISKLASEYEPPLNPFLTKEGKESKANRGGLFPRVWLDKKSFDFSFSGLKSAVKREVDKRTSPQPSPLEEREQEQFNSPSTYKGEGARGGGLSLEDKREISFEFQNAVTEVLAYKLVHAGESKRVKTVMLAGGVSANDKLSELIIEMCKEKGLNFTKPQKKVYSMDNAAMVGINAYYKVRYNKI